MKLFPSLLLEDTCCTIWLKRDGLEPQSIVLEEQEYALLKALFANTCLTYAHALSILLQLPLSLCYERVQEARATGLLPTLLEETKQTLSTCKKKIEPLLGLSISHVLDTGYVLLSTRPSQQNSHVEGMVAPDALKQGVWINAEHCLSLS